MVRRSKYNAKKTVFNGSRLDGHQWPLLSIAENCGRDPQANKCSDSLAGCAYPSRLALQMCGWRDSNPHNTDFKSVTFTSYITTAISSEGGIRTLKSLEPKSSAFASLTTPPNKKASQLREAYKSLLKKFRQYLASRHSLNNLTIRGTIVRSFSCYKYNSFALICAWAILFFLLSLNVNMKHQTFQPFLLLIYSVSGSVHREGLATRGTASMPEALFWAVALPLTVQVFNVVAALENLYEPHGFAAFGLSGALCGLLNGVSGET